MPESDRGKTLAQDDLATENPKLSTLNPKLVFMPYIGSRIRRKEDLRLLRGIGKYVGDIHRPGMVHAAILRSTHAHAQLLKIEAGAALKLPGVIGVLTAAECRE